MKFSEGGGLIRCHTPTSPHDRWSDMQRALIESWVLRLISMSVVMCYHRFEVHSREKRQEQMSNERFLLSLIWLDYGLLPSCHPLRFLPIAQFFVYPDRSLSKLVPLPPCGEEPLTDGKHQVFAGIIFPVSCGEASAVLRAWQEQGQERGVSDN